MGSDGLAGRDGTDDDALLESPALPALPALRVLSVSPPLPPLPPLPLLRVLSILLKLLTLPLLRVLSVLLESPALPLSHLRLHFCLSPLSVLCPYHSFSQMTSASGARCSSKFPIVKLALIRRLAHCYPATLLRQSIHIDRSKGISIDFQDGAPEAGS